MSVYRSLRQPDRVRRVGLEALLGRAKLLRAPGRSITDGGAAQGGQLTIVVEFCVDCEATGWLSWFGE